MIVIDTSAILAILQDEPERRSFNEAIEQAESCLMSTAPFVEASIVVESRFGYDGLRDFDLFIARAGIELVPGRCRTRPAQHASARFRDQSVRLCIALAGSQPSRPQPGRGNRAPRRELRSNRPCRRRPIVKIARPDPGRYTFARAVCNASRSPVLLKQFL